AEREHLLGVDFTVADLNVAAVVAGATVARVDLRAFSRLRGWLRRSLSRPAAQKVFSLAMQEGYPAGAQPAAGGASVVDWPGLPRPITRPDDTNEYFGWAIAVTASRLLIGSPHFADPDAPGRVYAFDVRTGALAWEARAPEGYNGDGFGAALATV